MNVFDDWEGTGCSRRPYLGEKKIESKSSFWAFIPCSGDDFGLTWLPPSRYSRTFRILIRTCFSSLPLDAAYEGTPTRHSKGRTTVKGESRQFRWGLWNTGKSSRLLSLQLLLSMFSRNGWRKFKQKSFPISPIDWTLISPFPYSPPPSHLHTTH